MANKYVSQSWSWLEGPPSGVLYTGFTSRAIIVLKYFPEVQNFDNLYNVGILRYALLQVIVANCT